MWQVLGQFLVFHLSQYELVSAIGNLIFLKKTLDLEFSSCIQSVLEEYIKVTGDLCLVQPYQVM